MPKKILLVEDDELLQKLLSEELKDDGYETTVASDGGKALHILKDKQTHLDLIILDLRMPKMDGIETMGHLIKMRTDTPIIIHTAYTSYREDVLAQAADAYIIKSHDLTELKSTVKRLIGAA